MKQEYKGKFIYQKHYINLQNAVIWVHLPKIINSTPIEIISKIETHILQGFSG